MPDPACNDVLLRVKLQQLFLVLLENRKLSAGLHVGQYKDVKRVFLLA